MSVISEQSSVRYAGNDSTSNPYYYPHYFFEPADLTVELRAADGGSMSISAISAQGTIVSVTTSGAHGLAVGDEVSIRDVTTDAYNKEFVEVANVLSSTQFQYVLLVEPASPGTVGSGVIVIEPAGVVTTLVLGTDFTVEGTATTQGYVNGADIKTTFAYDATYLVTIYRNIDAVQPLVYPENARFPAKSHERGLDRLTMLCQQALRAIKQTLSVRMSDNELGSFAAKENSVVGFDGGKQVRTYSLSELQTFLSLNPVPVIGMPIKTFADAGERALATPEFTGQLGTQRDAQAIYISTGTSAGDWTLFSLAEGNVPTSLITAAMLTATQSEQIAILDKISKHGADVASAGTVNLDTATGDLVDVTGTTTITAITLTEGRTRTVRFTGILTLTHGASLVLPSAANITTAAGDYAIFRGYAAGVVRCVSYTKASGEPVTGGYTPPAGTVLQTLSVSNTSYTAVNVAIPFDDSVPLVTEGIEVLPLAITPASSSNKVRVVANVPVAVNTTSQHWTLAVFRGTTCIKVSSEFIGYADISVDFIDSPATTSAVTYSVRVGCDVTSGFINGDSSSRNYGGASSANLILQEIKGS